MKKNVLILDDHAVVRKGVKALLQDYDPGLQIYEAGDGASTLELLKQQPVDIAIMDLQLPDTESIGLIEYIGIRYPHVYMLVFSMLPQDIYGRRVISLGASGYLSKDAPYDEVKKAFGLALSGRRYMSQELVDAIASQLSGNALKNPFEELSHREFEIIQLLLKGNTITAIGRALHIKPSTVGTYKGRIFDKMQVRTIYELQQKAALYGLSHGSFPGTPLSN